jgi:predicted alternative tryptophan synthase beta-subunit
MLEGAPSYIFYPVTALWSLVYGSLAGAWFKLLAAYENWIEMNRYQLILWKKYPQRSYVKYISGIWATQIKDKPVELAEYTRHQIEKRRPTEPFPIGRILINTIVMLIVTPFIILTGLYKGPIYVFRRALARRRELLINE